MADTAGGNKPEAWPVLDARERRVLGVLVEKSKTTPDAYPLSLNALTAGCNQKSNRDPVMTLDDVEAEDTLTRLQKLGLVLKVMSTSSRVERWRHQLYDAWHLDRVDLAILAELLLRGPQTEGELRTRAGRMEPFNDLESLRKALEPLVTRGLVVYLSPPGRRGTTLTQGFHAPDELDRLRKGAASSDAGEAPAPRPAPPAPPLAEVERLKQEVEALQAQVAALTQAVAALTEQLREVRQGLGL